MTLSEFAWSVFCYCSMLDASVTSWIRTSRHNRAHHGVAHSPHLLGLGVDVTYDVLPSRPEREEWAERCGLAIVFEHDHDHLQPKGWKPG